jgi:hypothetical protein
MKEDFPEQDLHKRGPLPELRDSEFLTMEIVGENPGLNPLCF